VPGALAGLDRIPGEDHGVLLFQPLGKLALPGSRAPPLGHLMPARHGRGFLSCRPHCTPWRREPEKPTGGAPCRSSSSSCSPRRGPVQHGPCPQHSTRVRARNQAAAVLGRAAGGLPGAHHSAARDPACYRIASARLRDEPIMKAARGPSRPVQRRGHQRGSRRPRLLPPPPVQPRPLLRWQPPGARRLGDLRRRLGARG
jgi:hypothetical protein